MHMADALISPAVGGTFWAASAGLIAYASRRVRQALDDRLVPFMGVLGAFVFAAQMINFSIPGTGSSGHLGGGLLLAVLLGPYAGFLVIASVLTVQALFFADGGLLALGCNMFNLGFFPCFIAYPFIYRAMVSAQSSRGMRLIGTIVAAVAGMEMGALGVVIQTILSGVSDLPPSAFLLAMLPVHFAIGIVEGLVTAAVVSFIREARPEFLEAAARRPVAQWRSMIPVAVAIVVAALFTGGILSWFASGNPDGLEWSVQRTGGSEDVTVVQGPVHEKAAHLQNGISLLPDYGFRKQDEAETATEQWPAVDSGTTVAGIVGGLIVLLMAFGIGALLRLSPKPSEG